MAKYPARLSITAIMTLFGTLQLLVLALIRVTDTADWLAFTWGSDQLFSVLYAVCNPTKPRKNNSITT
jgi:hypothetical protein